MACQRFPLSRFVRSRRRGSPPCWASRPRRRRRTDRSMHGVNSGGSLGRERRLNFFAAASHALAQPQPQPRSAVFSLIVRVSPPTIVQQLYIMWLATSHYAQVPRTRTLTPI
ncbi:hypothetical protein BDZ90DRAFT_166786 [Jaminaea rosea]|uniref:Uncharacterized protein n=1 Tax=Jaminaea rosea TaxID=1569628 RepID=A0A316UQK0_9BASI|nr:hypothetical protein BDZ90DRAFT_166786 [Jaminaea rosea]PWN27589.1 hypothetical protein BDZ90DRAFT_166786 [Jaminaea rosea]